MVHAAATLLVADEAPDGGVGVLEAIERAAQASAAQIGLAAITGVLDWASTHTPARAACPGAADLGADGADAAGHDARLVARRPKTVRTLLGPVDLVRGYYHCAGCRRGFAPLDTRLGVQGGSLSPGLERACALAGAEMPYAKSFEFIGTVTGLDLASTSTLARATRSEGTRARDLIAAEQQAARPGPPAAAGTADGTGPDLCYIVLDGTGAPMLPRECQGRAGKDGGRAGTREVKIGCFFTQSGTDPATGDPVQDPGSATYISTFAPAAQFGAQAKGEYHRRGFDQIRQPVVLGDGAHWIWNIADLHFPQATQIVDYFHAHEHLADLTKLLTPTLDKDPAAFEQRLVDALDLGDTDAITTAVKDLHLDHCAPELVKPARTEVGYFAAHRHRMQYADFKANGYYIGSGPVESACNTIVKQRAKRAGMHWSIHGLHPVLALRTLRQSSREHVLWPGPSPTPQT